MEITESSHLSSDRTRVGGGVRIKGVDSSKKWRRLDCQTDRMSHGWQKRRQIMIRAPFSDSLPESWAHIILALVTPWWQRGGCSGGMLIDGAFSCTSFCENRSRLSTDLSTTNHRNFTLQPYSIVPLVFVGILFGSQKKREKRRRPTKVTVHDAITR